MMSDKLQDKPICGRCEKNFVSGKHKIVICSTCKLNFHIDCAHVSQSKFDILCEEEDLFWFCNACKQTTANLINNLAHLELRLRAVEAEREKDKRELSTMQEKHQSLQTKVKSLEETISSLQAKSSSELESITFMVDEMLSEVPNCNAVVKRFENVEEHLQQCQQDLAKLRMSKDNNIYSGVNMEETSSLEATVDRFINATVK